jgi:hypothetical protein
LTVYQFERFSGCDWAGLFERFLKIVFLGRFGLTPFRFLRVNFDQNVHFQLDTECNWKHYRGLCLLFGLTPFANWKRILGQVFKTLWTRCQAICNLIQIR